MANIPLTGAGSLGVILGDAFGWYVDITATMGAAATTNILAAGRATNRYTLLETDAAAATPPLYNEVSVIPDVVAAYQSNQTTTLNDLNSYSQTVMISMANSSRALPSPTLTNAILLLNAQMLGSSDSFQQSSSSAGAQTAVGTPTGSSIVVVSFKRGDGLTVPTPYAETLVFQCTNDSYLGGTLGQEPFSYNGAAAVSKTSYLWPAGSGATGSLTSVDGSQDASGGNLLWNSDFETFTTTNVADNWTILVGSATTNVVNGTSGNAYLPSGGSIELISGAGATLTAITQLFDITPSSTVGAGGTSSTLSPATVYHLNLWIKMSATPAAGVLEFSLIDSGGTTVTNNQGTNNLFTKSLTAISTSYVNVSGAFQTPSIMPSAIKLKVRISTAITSPQGAFLADMSLTAPTQLYTGGPFASIASGATPVIKYATWTVAISSTHGVFLELFERNWNMASLGIILPSSGSATVSDSLISS